MKKENYGEIATVVGRYYAMDRDKRWERVKIAVEGLVNGKGDDGKGQDGIIGVVEENYKKDVTDEFLKPIIVNGSDGRIKGKSNFAVLSVSLIRFLERGRYPVLFQLSLRSRARDYDRFWTA
jgi:bisphosphoglycerate-independent phosphoglycerate mutase (AlkP superfamily)